MISKEGTSDSNQTLLLSSLVITTVHCVLIGIGLSFFLISYKTFSPSQLVLMYIYQSIIRPFPLSITMVSL
jgi:uncharacterized membrane protein YczE